MNPSDFTARHFIGASGKQFSPGDRLSSCSEAEVRELYASGAAVYDPAMTAAPPRDAAPEDPPVPSPAESAPPRKLGRR